MAEKSKKRRDLEKLDVAVMERAKIIIAWSYVDTEAA